MSVGHHALLKFAAGVDGVVSTSRFEHGQVLPVPFESAEGRLSVPRPGATFRSLKRVPRQDGTSADSRPSGAVGVRRSSSSWPLRRGPAWPGAR
jgi:hypothetical protein